MTAEGGKLIVNSPNALDGNYQAKLDTASAAYLSGNSSLVDGVFEDDATTLANIRSLVDMLPDNNMEDAESDLQTI